MSNSNNQSINDPLLKIFLKYKKIKNIILVINKLTNQYYQRIILNLLFFGLNLFGFYCYEQTLLGCYLSEIECLRINVVLFLSKLMPYLILSCLISGIFYCFIFIRKNIKNSYFFYFN